MGRGGKETRQENFGKISQQAVCYLTFLIVVYSAITTYSDR
jgi:hypothetical protein